MQEAGFGSVFEHSNDAILVFDPDEDEILAANPRAADLLEYTRAELEALRPRAVHADEGEAFDAFVDSVFSDGGRRTTALSCVTKTGRTVPAEVSATTFEHDGREVVLASIRDVDHRAERAAILDDLASTAATLIRHEDRTAIAEQAVAAADRMLGVELSHVYLRTEAEDVAVLEPAAVTETFSTRFGAPPAFERPEGLLWSTLEDGSPAEFEDVRAEAADEMATDLPFRNAVIFPLGDRGVFCIASLEEMEFDAFHYDVAEVLAAQVHAALDNAAHLGELEAKNDRLDEFARTVSHDLRNPLTVAQGHLEAVDGDGGGHVEAIRESLDRMEALIEDVLATAQAEDADVDLSLVSLSTFVSKCWTQVAAPDASVDVAEDATICADERLFKQLLENLFRNAAEHGRPDDGAGEGSLEVTVGALEDGFYVADDGVGIPEPERSKVFEPGYSEDEAGTGLGLQIVSRVASAHGWSVRATESEAGGARFEFTDVERV